MSLMYSDVGHLFMCLLAICMSFLKPCPLPIFNQIVLFIFFLLSCMSSLNIFGISPLSYISFVNIVSHLVGCLFALLVFFTVQKLSSLIKFHFLKKFCFPCSMDTSKNILLRMMSNSLLPIFSARSLWFLALHVSQFFKVFF